MKTRAPELSALIIILRSTGPVISTRRSSRSRRRRCHLPLRVANATQSRPGNPAARRRHAPRAPADARSRAASSVRRRSIEPAVQRRDEGERVGREHRSAAGRLRRRGLRVALVTEELSWRMSRGKKMSASDVWRCALPILARGCTPDLDPDLVPPRPRQAYAQSGSPTGRPYRRMEMTLHRADHGTRLALALLATARRGRSTGVRARTRSVRARSRAASPRRRCRATTHRPSTGIRARCRATHGFSLLGGAAIITIDGDFTQDTTLPAI